MNPDNLIKDKSHRSISIAIVVIMFLLLLLPPVPMVLADDEEIIFPNFEEADCECSKLISKFNMIVHRIYYDQDAMEVWFKMEQEGQQVAFLRQSTTWCSTPQYCQDARDSWFDTEHDWESWIETLQKVKDGIEQGYDYQIIELDDDIEDSRVSLVYLDPRSRCFGSRKFTYEDQFSVSITHENFEDPQILVDAMNDLEECIRAVLERKIQEMATREAAEGKDTEESPSVEDEPPPRMMGTAAIASGKVEIRRAGTDSWEELRSGMAICEGDEVRKFRGGFCIIRSEYIREKNHQSREIYMAHQHDCYFRMPTMEALNPPPHWSWEGIKGHFYIRIKELIESVTTGEVKIRTPNAISSVKGTEFEIIIEEDGTSIFNVIEGTVEVSDLNEIKTVMVHAGETTICEPGELPSEPQPIDIDSLDKWWESYPDEDEVSEDNGGINLAAIIVPVVLIVAAAAFALIFLRRRSNRRVA